jgi:hypothetical protein
MGNKEINILHDDALITEENEDNLPRFLYQFFLRAQKYNMKISNSRTNILEVYYIVCILKVQCEVVEQAMSSRSADSKQWSTAIGSKASGI